LGYESLEDYLQRGWEAGYRKRDPHNLLAMIDTWLRCDVSNNSIYQGDYHRALSSIQAKTLVMPSTTDLYFTLEDCEVEKSSPSFTCETLKIVKAPYPQQPWALVIGGDQCQSLDRWKNIEELLSLVQEVWIFYLIPKLCEFDNHIQ
jgi:hypothetical protein